MADLSQLTDQQLQQLAASRGIGAPQPKADLSALSDEQLNQLAQARGIAPKSATGEFIRPALVAAKNIAVGTVGSTADLAQEAVNLPYYFGFQGAKKATELVTGQKSNAQFQPLLGGVNTASPQIRQSFDSATGNLTTPRNQGEEVTQAIGEIVGGITGPAIATRGAQAATNLATSGGKKALQKLVGITDKSRQTLRAFQDSGVDPRLADITDSKPTKAFQNLLEVFPGSASTIQRSTQNQIDQITGQLAGLTKSKGGTIQETGKKIQEGAKSFKTDVLARDAKLYDDLDQFIPKTAEGQSAPIATSNLSKLIRTPEIEDVAAVGGGDTSRIISQFAKIADPQGNIPYSRLKVFRSTIGKKLQSPSLGGDDRAAIKQIYGALSEDMKAAVAANGGEKGLQAFNKANNAFARHNALLESKINPLIEAKTPEAVYNMALTGSKQGGSNIKPIMRTLDPVQQDYVRGTIVKRMGIQNPGLQDETGEVFSPNKFLTEWNKLSPEARANIFTKDQVAAVNNLNRAISGIKETSKIAQKSNNLPYANWALLGLLTSGSLTSRATQAAVSGVGARITAEMMTNPKFINWLAKAPKVRSAEIPQHLKALSAIAAANPSIQEDVLDYLDSITMDANAQEPENLSVEQIRDQILQQQQEMPGLNANRNVEQDAAAIKQRFYRE